MSHPGFFLKWTDSGPAWWSIEQGWRRLCLLPAEWVKPPGKAWRPPQTLFNTTFRILLKVVKRGNFGSAPYVSISRVGEVKMPRKSSKCLLPPFFEPDFNCSSPTIGSLRSGCRPFIAREHWFFRGSGMNNWSPVQRLKEKNLTSRFPKNSACPYGPARMGMTHVFPAASTA